MFATLKFLLQFCPVYWAVVTINSSYWILKRWESSRRCSRVIKWTGWPHVSSCCYNILARRYCSGFAEKLEKVFLRAGAAALSRACGAVRSVCVRICTGLSPGHGSALCLARESQRRCSLHLSLSKTRIALLGRLELFLELGGKNVRYSMFLVHSAGKLVYSGFQRR